jgi:hypothetical protein
MVYGIIYITRLRFTVESVGAAFALSECAC